MNYTRNSFVMSYLREFTVKVEGEDRKFNRLYDISIPLGSNWDEIFGVMTEAIADLKKLQEDDEKKKEEDIKAAEEAKTSEAPSDVS
jgi:hypothetical protein